jgi:hypothetical protein
MIVTQTLDGHQSLKILFLAGVLLLATPSALKLLQFRSTPLSALGYTDTKHEQRTKS